MLDLPHGGVVGRAQPRTSSIVQLSERLRARQKVRVEVRKLHQYVWAGQRHPSRRPGSPRCGTVASRRHQQQEGARLPNQPGARPGVASAGGRGGGVGRGCGAGRARRRNRSEHSPGRCRASRAPIRSPPGSGSSLMCRVPAAVVGEHGDVKDGGRVSRPRTSDPPSELARAPGTTPLPAASKNQSLFAHDSEIVTARPEAHRRQHGERRCWIPLAVH